jgi:hypothetical protein
MQVGQGPTCIPDGHLHRVTYTRCCIDITDSPDDEHKVAQNMYRIEINIYKKIVRQVGYLLELEACRRYILVTV